MEIPLITFSKQRVWALLIVLFALLILLITKLSWGHIFSFLIPIIWIVLVQNKNFSSLGLSRTNFIPSIITGVISGIILSLIAGVIFKISELHKVSLDSARIYEILEEKMSFGNLAFKSASIYMLQQSKTTKGLFSYFLYMVFSVGLGEEIFWRGFMQQHVFFKLSNYKAILITTVLFTLVHSYLFFLVPIGIGIIFLFIIGIASIIWGWMFFQLKNIWGTALSHGITAFIIWRYYFFIL